MKYRAPKLTRAIAALLLAIALIAQARAEDAAAPVEDELTRLFRPANHYLVEHEPIVNELGPAPLPFLDWGLVQPGFVEYVDRASGNPLPLNEPHDVEDPAQVEARAFCLPSALTIEVQPAQDGGTFREALFAPVYPWEERCEVHTLLHDEAAGLYRLWYQTRAGIAYAESMDLRDWRRPLHAHRAMEGHAATNLLGVLDREQLAQSDLRAPEEARPGRSGAFFVDPSAAPEARFKCTFLAHVRDDTAAYAERVGRPRSAMTGPGSTVMFGAVSADGVGWRVLPRPIMLHDADTMTVARFDPLLEKLVMYTRLYELSRRSIARSETADFADWPLPVGVLSAGGEERPTIDYYSNAATHYPGQPRLRLLFCNAYDRSADRSEIRLAVSQDGRSFDFPPGGPIIAPGAPAAAHAGFLQPFPSLVRTPEGRFLLFYNQHDLPHKFPRHRFASSASRAAVWPADRLAALVAHGQGEFTTAPLLLRGDTIVLNFRSLRSGGLEVELRDERFRIVPGRSFADCDPLVGDHTAATVRWQGASDISPWRGQTVYLRFRLRHARLYSLAAP